MATVVLHEPDGVISLKVIVDPKQTCVGPVIGAGYGLTVTVVSAMQPPGSVKVIVAVPALILLPVTIPVELTVATLTLLLLHVPPAVISLKEVVVPRQMLVLPVIG